MTNDPKSFPPGWDDARARRLAAHYEQLSEDDQVAEDEAAAQEGSGQAVISVPQDMLPAIRQLLSGQQNA